MDIERTGGKPLTAEQQALLDLFRAKVDEVIKYRGLSESDVKRLVKEVRASVRSARRTDARFPPQLRLGLTRVRSHRRRRAARCRLQAHQRRADGGGHRPASWCWRRWVAGSA